MGYKAHTKALAKADREYDAACVEAEYILNEATAPFQPALDKASATFFVATRDADDAYQVAIVNAEHKRDRAIRRANKKLGVPQV